MPLVYNTVITLQYMKKRLKEIAMKKFFAAAAVFTLILVSFVSTAAAEQFDGFTINFPDDFTGAYTDVDTDIKSDFFTDNLL